MNTKEVELVESRLASERTMVQMMELTNEVNTKQDEVGAIVVVSLLFRRSTNYF